MKKTALFLATSAALLLGSCQKSHCWKCTTSTTTTPNGVVIQPQVSEPWTVCEMTARQIRAYEQAHSSIDTNGIVTITKTTTCQ